MSEVLQAKPIPAHPRVSSPFEFWPGWVFYAPVVLHWLLLGIRHGSFSLPTAANPYIESGGLCGESKSKILDQVDGSEREWIANYVKVHAGYDTLQIALDRLERARIKFPIVLKPDVGCHGNGVRLVDDAMTLERVMTDFPVGVCLLLQEFIPFDGEAGAFYVRIPGSQARITSLTLKFAPEVIGNGRSTLRQLILVDPRTGKIAHLFYQRLQARLDDVIPGGTAVRLVFTGNHCKGSIFRNGVNDITAGLTARVDKICRSMPDFHFGRIDLRFSDVAALRRGDRFRIIEINGVGSEATHIWDPETTLLQAYRAQFQHYGLAFQIGDLMRRAGHRPTSLRRLLKLWRHQSRLMSSYPVND